VGLKCESRPKAAAGTLKWMDDLDAPLTITPPPMEEVQRVLAEEARHPYGRGELGDYAMTRWLLGLPIEVSVELMDVGDSE
jgi:hypothetical protein